MSFQVNGEKKTETKEESIILSKVCVCVYNYGRLLLPDQNEKKTNKYQVTTWKVNWYELTF